MPRKSGERWDRDPGHRAPKPFQIPSEVWSGTYEEFSDEGTIAARTQTLTTVVVSVNFGTGEADHRTHSEGFG